jgi:hypothetical protein
LAFSSPDGSTPWPTLAHLPDIFDADQICQFTTAEWTGRLIA